MKADAPPKAWNGAFTILPAMPAAGYSVTMAPPVGTMAFTAQQTQVGNDPGVIQLAAGGYSVQVPADPGAAQPSVYVWAWSGDQLVVSNVSSGAGGVPRIGIQAMGPGIPGVTPSRLPNNATRITIQQFGAAVGTTNTQVMTLRMTCVSNVAVVAVIGGPPYGNPPNNGYLIALNSPSGYTGVASGASLGVPAGPDQYYATTPQNQFDFKTWQGSYSFFVANLSQSTAPVNLQLF